MPRLSKALVAAATAAAAAAATSAVGGASALSPSVVDDALMGPDLTPNDDALLEVEVGAAWGSSLTGQEKVAHDAVEFLSIASEWISTAEQWSRLQAAEPELADQMWVVRTMHGMEGDTRHGLRKTAMRVLAGITSTVFTNSCPALGESMRDTQLSDEMKAQFAKYKPSSAVKAELASNKKAKKKKSKKDKKAKGGAPTPADEQEQEDVDAAPTDPAEYLQSLSPLESLLLLHARIDNSGPAEKDTPDAKAAREEVSAFRKLWRKEICKVKCTGDAVLTPDAKENNNDFCMRATETIRSAANLMSIWTSGGDNTVYRDLYFAELVRELSRRMGKEASPVHPSDKQKKGGPADEEPESPPAPADESTKPEAETPPAPPVPADSSSDTDKPSEAVPPPPPVESTGTSSDTSSDTDTATAEATASEPDSSSLLEENEEPTAQQVSEAALVNACKRVHSFLKFIHSAEQKKLDKIDQTKAIVDGVSGVLVGAAKATANVYTAGAAGQAAGLSKDAGNMVNAQAAQVGNAITGASSIANIVEGKVGTLIGDLASRKARYRQLIVEGSMELLEGELDWSRGGTERLAIEAGACSHALARLAATWLVMTSKGGVLHEKLKEGDVSVLHRAKWQDSATEQYDDKLLTSVYRKLHKFDERMAAAKTQLDVDRIQAVDVITNVAELSNTVSTVAGTVKQHNIQEHKVTIATPGVQQEAQERADAVTASQQQVESEQRERDAAIAEKAKKNE